MVIDSILGMILPKKPTEIRPTRAWTWKYKNTAAIPAGGVYCIGITDNDYFLYGMPQGGFLVCSVSNLSSENVEVWLDNDQNKGDVITPGQSLPMNGIPYRQVYISNLDATREIAINEIYVKVASW